MHSPNAAQILRTESTAACTSIMSPVTFQTLLRFSEEFFVHYEKAPYNDDLMIAGTATLWRCTDFFSATTPAWSANSPTMFGVDGTPMPINCHGGFAPSDTSGSTYALGLQKTAN